MVKDASDKVVLGKLISDEEMALCVLVAIVILGTLTTLLNIARRGEEQGSGVEIVKLRSQ